VVGIATLFTLARFSEAFLILRAQGLGLPIALTPMVLVVMNIVYALAAYPAGVLSDRFHRLHVLGAGFVLLIAADMLLAFAPGLVMVAGGVVLFGLHMGFTQGVFATLIADCAPPDLRGTAFGLFNLLTGGALLAASVIAGGLWDLYGAQATFIAGATFAAAALAGLFLLHRKAPLVGDAKAR
jgi:MFS family permease